MKNKIYEDMSKEQSDYIINKFLSDSDTLLWSRSENSGCVGLVKRIDGPDDHKTECHLQPFTKDPITKKADKDSYSERWCSILVVVRKGNGIWNHVVNSKYETDHKKFVAKVNNLLGIHEKLTEDNKLTIADAAIHLI